MHRYSLLIIIVCFRLFAAGQSSDTLRNAYSDEVVVTAYKDEPVSRTPIHIEALAIDSANRLGSFQLSEMLARSAGVTMLSTGPLIAKPVIRGLYGNRVLVLLNGLKFDNQQWQEEHGLGLTAFGLSKVELIRGPMGILYGSEAMGGVINLIEEAAPETDGRRSDVRLLYNTNTNGGQWQWGTRVRKGSRFWRIRIGGDNHADYSDGNHQRVLNSRADGYYAKATYGFHRRKWKSVNNYAGSFNRFGFIFNDIYEFVYPDARQSRRLNVNPAHMVMLNILSSENQWKVNERTLFSLNAGVQSNHRMENEGGGAISLNMHLLTAQALLKFERTLSEDVKLMCSSLQAFEDNTNYGARKIVPDARMREHNLSVNVEWEWTRHFIWENGAGVGQKVVHTFFTPLVNGPEKEIHPFLKTAGYYNFFSGITYFPSQRFNIKANISTGVRVANLAELSSDGLHEGVFTYEIGNPNLKNEQIASLNVYMHWMPGKWQWSISPFFNQFKNYIYLSPTNEEWNAFPVYRYFQQDAQQYGGEASVGRKESKHWQWRINYSGMVSKTVDGNITPYLPAQRLSPWLQVNVKVGKQRWQCAAWTDAVMAQSLLAPNEKATPAYTLWNASLSSEWKWGERSLQWSVSGNNLTNKAYFDHLSRLKNYGILNMGRNVVISLAYNY